MKLARHIRRLLTLGYPQEILCSPRMVQHILKLNEVAASRNHVRAAINRHSAFILAARY